MNKFFILMVIAIGICFTFSIYSISKYSDNKIDITIVNAIAKAAAANEGREQSLAENDFSYNFTVVGKDGMIRYSTKDAEPSNYTQMINEAIRNHETVLYYHAGAVIIYTNDVVQVQQNNLMNLFLVVFGILILFLGSLYFYIRKRIIRPFDRLKTFAASIAKGNFDLPLPMDRSNIFGAFSESFDLMRTELKAAQAKSILLEKQKNEMVASLSHDIKTPLSSIIAVSEMMLLIEQDEEKRSRLSGIERKAEEIDQLISDLFQTTLEDLSELHVNTQPYPSDLLTEIIHSADLLNKIETIPSPPSCLVMLDPLRIGQVFGNLISNSYKYANSPITIHYQLIQSEKQMLQIEIKDQGNSLSREDVGKLDQKFYRGSNAAGIQGVGLGLYNCKMLLTRMDGHLEFAQEPSGFAVKIYLPLS